MPAASCVGTPSSLNALYLGWPCASWAFRNNPSGGTDAFVHFSMSFFCNHGIKDVSTHPGRAPSDCLCFSSSSVKFHPLAAPHTLVVRASSNLALGPITTRAPDTQKLRSWPPCFDLKEGRKESGQNPQNTTIPFSRAQGSYLAVSLPFQLLLGCGVGCLLLIVPLFPQRLGVVQFPHRGRIHAVLRIVHRPLETNGE